MKRAWITMFVLALLAGCDAIPGSLSSPMGSDTETAAPNETPAPPEPPIVEAPAPPVETPLAFLKLDGIKGNADERGFEDTIELQHVKYDFEQVLAEAAGSGAGAGRAELSPVIVEATPDRALPALIDRLLKGTVITTGQIEIVKPGEELVVIQRISLKGVRVVELSFDGNDDKIEISLSYEEIKIEQFTQDASGKVTSAGSVCWNVVENAPCP